MKLHVGIIGIGRFGGALARSLSREGRHEVWLLNRNREKAEVLSRETGAAIAENASILAQNSEVVVLAVKPKDIDAALLMLCDHLGARLLVSVAAGITTSHIESQLREGARVVRAMPNLGFGCGEGATGYALGRRATSEDERVARELFGKGVCLRVEEEQLDAVTGVSGSGIAFLAKAMDAIARAGEAEGLPYETALLLAAQSAIGAGLLVKNGMGASEIIGAVTSPNGTTAKGWEAWDANELSRKLEDVVRAAIRRARELRK